MFDIHYHLIFGVDDGPKTIEDSIALAEASIAEGVTHILATPHANDTYPYQPEVNRERLAMLKEHLDGRLTLGLGCDFHLSYDNIIDLRRNPTKYTVNGKQYLLVEFPDLNIPQSITQAFNEMIGAGIVPILTHPERNPVLMRDPERMAEWIQSGCLLQVTAASLRGRFGPKSEAMAFELVKRNWVHIIASDAHSVEGRTPSMERAHSVLVESAGQETADRLCIENPRAVFFGEKLKEQPRPMGLGREQQSKRGLFGRMFGK
ncbi:MAG TPA: CpsB/CapC family capsule biosynthesis tyrosine phosphatase [Terracidiphilus sp.]|nr:CpsB/CapC family capsule biosynthesis tyrosine phosphatase [Terracidiphilus sp.]